MEKREKELEERGRTSLRKYNNFTVIPITTWKRHHIGIDDRGLYCLMRLIESKHAAMRRKDVSLKNDKELRPKDYAELWRHYFDIDKIERVPKNENAVTIKFDNHISTDGVAEFQNNKNENSSCSIERKTESCIGTQTERM